MNSFDADELASLFLIFNVTGKFASKYTKTLYFIKVLAGPCVLNIIVILWTNTKVHYLIKRLSADTAVSLENTNRIKM